MVKRNIVLVIFTLLLSAQVSAVEDAQSLRRFGLFVGANDGGVERLRLRWAASDARNVAGVLYDVGGLSPRDSVVLEDPSKSELEQTLGAMRRMVSEAAGSARRVEFVLYYSGHSDEFGLLLGDQHYSYTRLRADVQGMGADVAIAILDSCASGAFTRLKGGDRVQPFLIDDSSDMSGHAFLTSSSEDEDAQESDSIQASFFTHYLVSGLRGAADATGDGRVTLHEAYDFARGQTLSRTQGTLAGPQHPAFEFQLNGTGDLVITQVSSATSSLRLEAGLDGRILVQDERSRPIAEISKSAPSTTMLALAPGRYTVSRTKDGRTSRTDVSVRFGSQASLAESDFVVVPREVTRSRGSDSAENDSTEMDVEHARRLFEIDPDSPGEIRSNIPGLPRAFVGVAPGFGWRQGSTDGPAVLSLGALVARESGVQGYMSSGLIAETEEAMLGIQQSGVGATVGGDLIGLQTSGVFGVVGGNMVGAQSSGVFNTVEGDASFFQSAGVFNQVRGTFNGVQVAGLANFSKDVNGVQIAPLNTAKRVNGLQIGVVNISDELYGLPIGLINIVRNGIQEFSYWYGDADRATIGFQNGSNIFYTLFFAGVRTDEPIAGLPGLNLGAGLGMRLSRGIFFLDADVSATTVGTGADREERFERLFRVETSFPTARLLGGIQFGSFGFFLGGSFDAELVGVTSPVPGHHDSEDPYDLQPFGLNARLHPRFIIGFKF